MREFQKNSYNNGLAEATREVGRVFRTKVLSYVNSATRFWRCETPFCAVAYFRFVYPGGRVQCAFVAAKTRVAPVRPLSIPKLELQAALLSLRLGNMIKKEHDFDISPVYVWSDSIAVLGQIRGPSKHHPAFIANRLSEILDTSESNQWRHCPGKLNPADDGSRGLRAYAITSESRWLNGPAFLVLPENI